MNRPVFMTGNPWKNRVRVQIRHIRFARQSTHYDYFTKSKNQFNSTPMKAHVIVSLTSIKSREAALQETLASLIAQDISCHYEVRVHLSQEPYLLDEGFAGEPTWVGELATRNPHCSLSVRFVRNTGPYRKLLPVLEEFIDNVLSAVIVTCDDDTYYDPSWLRTILRHHSLTGSLVAYRGHTACLHSVDKRLLPYSSWQENPHKCHFSLTNLPTGKDGVVYRPYYFDHNVLNVDEAMRLAPTADDLWFRWHSLVRGVPCYLIDLNDQVLKSVASFEKEVSLWECYNKKDGNDRTIAVLEKHFQQTSGTSVSNVLNNYIQGLSMSSLPSFDTGRKYPAMLAARQVRVLNAMHGEPDDFRAVSALSYELTRLSFCRRLPVANSFIEPLSDRGGMLYAREAVDRFDDAYGWMARGADAGENQLVTVIMTTFNAKDTVEWAVRSVLSQDHRRLELIVVDDVSTDGTREILKKLRRSHPRIKLVFLKRNRGTYFAKNIGLRLAKGDVITFQDADDWSHPARVRLQLWRLMVSGAIATRCSYVRHHTSLNQLVKVNGRVESPGYITLMAHRDVFEEDGYFDCSRRAADDELICRLQALHGTDAVDTFMLPAYVALYSDQSLIADSSKYSAKEGLSFRLGEDREHYKQAYNAWHERLRETPNLKNAYAFPPKSIFIEKSPSLRAFEPEEIDSLPIEINIENLVHSHPTGRLSLERKNGLVLS
jgi:hypothetical protein